MSPSMKRRDFLAGSLAGGVATAAGLSSTASAGQSPPQQQEFYELRIYRLAGGNSGQLIADYLKTALLPALARMGLDRIGVFRPQEEDQPQAIYTLIPYPTLEVLAGRNSQLAADEEYQKAAAEHFARPKKDRTYTRIESRLMKAFAGMPVMELPPQSKEGKPRIFEVRVYESHNEHLAQLKVEMFNKGEIDIMRKVNMAPVFYGETLISDDLPNLTYMLSAPDLESHKQHWGAFRVDADWDRMKKMKRYQGTVSKITSVMLTPLDCSQI